MATFGQQYEFAVYSGLMAQLENFEREHQEKYGNSSAFKECFYRIEPGRGMLVRPFGGRVELRFVVEVNGTQWCECRFEQGDDGLMMPVTSRLQFLTLDDLQDWLELQGDPTG